MSGAHCDWWKNTWPARWCGAEREESVSHIKRNHVTSANTNLDENDVARDNDNTFTGERADWDDDMLLVSNKRCKCHCWAQSSTGSVVAFVDQNMM